MKCKHVKCKHFADKRPSTVFSSFANFCSAASLSARQSARAALFFCPPASPQYESDESPSRSGVQWALDWRYERCCLWLCIMWLTLDSGPSKFVDSQSQDGFGCTLCNYIGAWQTQRPRSSWRDSRTFLQCGSASRDVMDFTPPAARVGWSDASRQAPHWHLMLTVANEKMQPWAGTTTLDIFHMHQNAWRAWGRGGRKITNRDSRDHGKMFTFSSTFENLQEVRPSLDMCLYCKWSEKDPAPMPEYASCVWISYSKSFSKFFRNRSDCGNWVMSCQALYLCHLNNPPKVVGPEGQFFAATWPG